MGLLKWFRRKTHQTSSYVKGLLSDGTGHTASHEPGMVPGRLGAVTGRWRGSYFQHDTGHAIMADLAHSGGRLTGTMTDGETESERSVFDMTVEAGLPPGSDEQIIASLRNMFPESPRAEVRY